jgi:hypothetical protein
MKTRIRMVGVMATTVVILVLGTVPAQAMVLVSKSGSPGTPYLTSALNCAEVNWQSAVNNGENYVEIPQINFSRSPATTGNQYVFLRISLEYWNGSTFVDAGTDFSTGWHFEHLVPATSPLVTSIYGGTITVPHGWTWRVKLEFAWARDAYGHGVMGSATYRPRSAGYHAVNDAVNGLVTTIGSWSGYGFCAMP